MQLFESLESAGVIFLLDANDAIFIIVFQSYRLPTLNLNSPLNQNVRDICAVNIATVSN